MLQAAVTGCFDFTEVTPLYYTKLALVLRELRRMNVTRLAENAALHCAILASASSGETKSTNMKRLEHNMGIMSLYLRQRDLNAESEEDDPILKEWKKRNGIIEEDSKL